MGWKQTETLFYSRGVRYLISWGGDALHQACVAILLSQWRSMLNSRQRFKKKKKDCALQLVKCWSREECFHPNWAGPHFCGLMKGQGYSLNQLGQQQDITIWDHSVITQITLLSTWSWASDWGSFFLFFWICLSVFTSCQGTFRHLWQCVLMFPWCVLVSCLCRCAQESIHIVCVCTCFESVPAIIDTHGLLYSQVD